jgi:hypothetical protein
MFGVTLSFSFSMLEDNRWAYIEGDRLLCFSIASLDPSWFRG